MKFPKTMNRFCPKCKKHTPHKVELNKKRNASSLTYGSKHRARLRGQARGHGNRGRYSKPAVSSFKMTGKKASKKVDLRYRCSTCKKAQIIGEGFRAKRLEFV
ncbi:50S ribosomal protein L44e [Candidatus Woesearchaeota archaeon]|nr:50S ribosomal protein L44e [Candidatus Woesearchaeota archaeon]